MNNDPGTYWQGNNSKTSLDMVVGHPSPGNDQFSRVPDVVFITYCWCVCIVSSSDSVSFFLYRQRLTHFLPIKITYCLENGFSQGPRTCGTRVVFYSAHKHENKHI